MGIEVYTAKTISVEVPQPAAPRVQAGGGQTTTAPVSSTSTSATAPKPDAGKTWGGPDSTRDLNFGHHTVSDENGNASLFTLHGGLPMWADTKTMLTADQFAAMPKFQQAKLLGMVPPQQLAAFQQAMAKGDASKAQTQPKNRDNSQISPVATAMAGTNQVNDASVAAKARAAQIAANPQPVIDDYAAHYGNALALMPKAADAIQHHDLATLDQVDKQMESEFKTANQDYQDLLNALPADKKLPFMQQFAPQLTQMQQFLTSIKAMFTTTAPAAKAS